MGSLFFFFFFQAEDGIRDGHVTGVQTCALPIFREAFSSRGGLRRPAAKASRTPPRCSAWSMPSEPEASTTSEAVPTTIRSGLSHESELPRAKRRPCAPASFSLIAKPLFFQRVPIVRVHGRNCSECISGRRT